VAGGSMPGYAGRLGSGRDPYAAGAETYGHKTPNRELRIVFGILCILGGLVSGAGAIVVAFSPH
jgi:hypothetical protein